MRKQALAMVFALIAALMADTAGAQYYQSDFPPEEFKARWNAIYDAIGDNAVALVQGGPSARGFDFPRQTNDFYYLTGVETAHSYLFLDGRTRKSTLYLPPRNERLERSEGRILTAADADLVKKLTGADHVRSTEELRTELVSYERGAPAASIYAPFAPAEGYAQSRHEIQMADANIANDYWDGRIPREQQLVSLLRARHPRNEIRDLTPILDEMRTIKSEREIALVRKASVLAALGIMEAMRSTKEGVFEYQLDAAARYVFLVNGSRLDGYRSITASGTENLQNQHYFRNTRRLRNGELVLMDYAPDVGNYVSDIGRMWPVSGRFSPVQRELLQTVLVYRDEIISRIRPGVTTAQILEETKEPMRQYIKAQRYSKAIYRKAVEHMVETGSGAFTHMVGLAVHDVGEYQNAPLRPGIVFSVDPTLRVPEEKIYMRYEDIVVVTEDGVENFTDFMPAELDDIEAMVRGVGVVGAFPPVHELTAKAASAGIAPPGE